MLSYVVRTETSMRGGEINDNEVSDDESLEAYDGYACDDTDTGVVPFAV